MKTMVGISCESLVLYGLMDTYIAQLGSVHCLCVIQKLAIIGILSNLSVLGLHYLF